MALLEVLHCPDERLRRVAAPVRAIDDALRRLAQDMVETMYGQGGVGLAATQVGVELQILVMDVSGPPAEDDGLWEPSPTVLINPRLVRGSGDIVWAEGCLSLPGVRAEVERLEHITVEAFDLEGEAFEMEATGLASVCVQHEMDHLVGKLFIDHLGPLERKAVLEAFLAGQAPDAGPLA